MQTASHQRQREGYTPFFFSYFLFFFFLYFSSPGELSGDVLISVTRSILIGFNSLTILLFVLKLSI
ncbi:unnamed protein product [Brassica oleracea var. botrytis]|uniref:Uncharacterized protein n=1 Tax=Brassica oleracea TaxID=3712 RepID=A0A3P6D1H4_BRAOL|nr:unnamed protein product [Brassica oleracea]